MNPMSRSFALAALLVALGGSCHPIERPAESASGTDARSPSSCTITGTARDDVLRGTSGDDTICGIGGNDVLMGRGGRDVLIGGAGSDALFGGTGADEIRGGSGIDLLEGGPGAETLRGGSGDDRCPVRTSDRVGSCSGLSRDPIVAAAGDIACPPGDRPDADSCRQMATSELLVNGSAWTVLTLGDNQYEDGELQEFQGSYAASWGRVKAITRPSPGNHDYHVSGGEGYYTYFGPMAGKAGEGYYSFDVGSWHLVALNSNCGEVGGCGEGSPQEEWLRRDLASNPASCTLAYWHHPRFSSGRHGSNGSYDAFWRALDEAGADVMLNGHDHSYERFAPQDPDQQADPDGIREFVVGAGGKSHYEFESTEPNSQRRHTGTFGILELTLHPEGYEWRFVPEAGGGFLDTGSGSCH